MENQHTANPNRFAEIFRKLQLLLLAIGAMISVVHMLGWLLPQFSGLLPEGWYHMKANTAFCFLLSIFAILPLYYSLDKRVCTLSRVAAFVVLLFALTNLHASLYNTANPFDTLFANDPFSDTPGRMSTRTALFFLFNGAYLLIARTKAEFSSKNYLCDILLFASYLLIMIIISGYIFKATLVFSDSPTTLTSPQTLACMICTVIALTAFPGNSGLFSTLTGSYQGSHIVRYSFLPATALPFIILGIYSFFLTYKLMPRHYAATISTSIMAPLLLMIILLMGKRLNKLQQRLENISYTDALTQIYNRRGFYMFGLHMYHESIRNETPLSVIFIDSDGLKKINDTIGHEAGSAMLKDIARLMQQSFRKSDIIARIGGDEFAAISSSPIDDMLKGLKRMHEQTKLINETEAKPYQISYSAGESTLIHCEKTESFNQLIDRADSLMYKHKQEKKRKAMHVDTSPDSSPNYQI